MYGQVFNDLLFCHKITGFVTFLTLHDSKYPCYGHWTNIFLLIWLSQCNPIVYNQNETILYLKQATTEMFAEKLRTIIIFIGKQNTIYVLKCVLLSIFLKKHLLYNCM